MTLEKKFNFTEFFKHLRNPKISGGILVASLSTSALFVYADFKVDKMYVEAGGITNAPISNLEKIQYIKSHSNHYPTNSASEYLDKK